MSDEKNWDTLDLVAVAIVFFIVGAALSGYLISDVMGYSCYYGGYIQAMKNCVASHDWNSSWCMMPWVRTP
jgi:hypothetical protein